jgi:hypothetical protein
MTMPHLRTDNRKLPAWIGSILFHAVLLLLLLFWFSLSPSGKSAPGERNADGTIVFRSADTRQQSASPNSADSDVTEIVLERFVNDVALTIPPPIRTIAPGGNTPNNASNDSATNLVTSMQQGALTNTGIGNAGEATVQVFGLPGTGRKFMYVFDRSNSMGDFGGRPIQRAKEELIRSLDSLDDLHQFNIIFYSGRDTMQLWQPGRRLVFASPIEKERACRFVEGIVASGGTWHLAPLKEAVAHRPDVIFFLTDGEAKDDLSPDQLQEIDRANNQFRAGAQINVIQFGTGGLTDPSSRSLRQLAEDNRGLYKYVNVATLR